MLWWPRDGCCGYESIFRFMSTPTACQYQPCQCQGHGRGHLSCRLAGALVDDLMGGLVAESVGRAYSGRLNRQQRWGPARQSVPQVQEENGEGEETEEERDIGRDDTH